MNAKLRREIERLQAIFAWAGVNFEPQEGASPNEIAQVEEKVRITFNEDLKALWQFSNGSGDQRWFTDAQFPCDFFGCSFLSLQDGFEKWRLFEPYDETHYRKWHYDGSWGPQIRRIQREYLHHRLWFPLTQDIGSTVLYFDADPTDKGVYGQIIAYEHDPDQIDYVAPSFLDFFRTSNDILEESVKDDPE